MPDETSRTHRGQDFFRHLCHANRPRVMHLSRTAGTATSWPAHLAGPTVDEARLQSSTTWAERQHETHALRGTPVSGAAPLSIVILKSLGPRHRPDWPFRPRRTQLEATDWTVRKCHDEG
jgi:hypothetical protein